MSSVLGLYLLDASSNTSRPSDNQQCPNIASCPWRGGWETAPSLEPLLQPKCRTQFSAEACSTQSCLTASWAHHQLYKFPKNNVNCSQVHLSYKGSDIHKLLESTDPGD